MQCISKLIPKLICKNIDIKSGYSIHYAFYIRGKTIIRSHNTRYIHAETNLLNKLCYLNVKKSGRILIIRVKNSGLSMSKPCKLCISKLKESKLIKTVLYSTDNDTIIEERISKIESDHIPKSMKIF